MEGPAVEPKSPANAHAAIARTPPFELWIAFGFSLVPHAAGLLAGGYGRIITSAPVAVIVTIVDVVALVIAYLQFREDSRAERGSHWLVWATVAAGAIWLVYAVFIGAVVVVGRALCIDQVCRGLIH